MVSKGKNPDVFRVRCRSKTGASANLKVLDISAGGAMVESLGWPVRRGERVLLGLPGLSIQPGEVVWIEDGRAGIAFEQLLYQPVLDHLQNRVVA